MRARELAEQILREIEEGTLDPEAIVVRPFCMCDEEPGYVEARYLDQVVRRYEIGWQPPDPEHGENPIDSRIFKKGSVAPGPSTETTLKLG
jgi:hypothetical protein